MNSQQTIFDRLRARGERLTIQRRAVLEVLAAQGDHLTVQEIQAEAARRGLELTETTVYRIVQWLKDLGVVSQTDLGQSGTVYELIGPQRHHHLVCLNCGAVIDVDDALFDVLRARLRAEYDFEPRIDHMAIFGLCAACRDSGDATG
jgi:Fur family transcriptional regulator, ferric uptake regulator